MKASIIIAVTSIILILAIYSPMCGVWKNQYDDSYITYRYAVNLAEQFKPVYNLSERGDGCSSFLYMVILAGFHRVGFHNLEMVYVVLSLMAAGLIAAFVYLSLTRMRVWQPAAVILSLISVLHGFVSGWAVSGMETTVFTALLVVWVYCTILTGWPYRNMTLSIIIACVDKGKFKKRI